MKNFKGEASERTWLISILKRKVIDHYRKINSNKGKAEVRITYNNDSETEGDWLEERVADPFDKTAEDTMQNNELGDAILDNDLEEVKKELGDLLLHIVFYAKIGSETNDFDMADVANSICEKLISRHPHIYSDVVVANEEEVKQNWEKLKLKEGKTSVLEGVPKSLPAVVKATRIQEKVKGVGFEWDNRDDVWKKVKEEITELEIEVNSNKSIEKIEDEFGDVLFSLINYARFINVNPENALAKTNIKFINRFQKMEILLKENGHLIEESSLELMDKYWEQAKKFEK